MYAPLSLRKSVKKNPMMKKKNINRHVKMASSKISVNLNFKFKNVNLFIKLTQIARCMKCSQGRIGNQIEEAGKRQFIQTTYSRVIAIRRDNLYATFFFLNF